MGVTSFHNVYTSVVTCLTTIEEVKYLNDRQIDEEIYLFHLLEEQK